VIKCCRVLSASLYFLVNAAIESADIAKKLDLQQTRFKVMPASVQPSGRLSFYNRFAQQSMGPVAILADAQRAAGYGHG
jgi:hypothetical protein